MTFSELPIGKTFNPCLGFKSRMRKVTMNHAVFESIQGDNATGEFRVRIPQSKQVKAKATIQKLVA